MEDWCEHAPPGCSQNVTSGCVAYKVMAPSKISKHFAPICAEFSPITLSGASGSNAEWINGVYDPTGEAYNDKPLFQKRDDPGRWLRFVTFGGQMNWRVSDTANKEEKVDKDYKAAANKIPNGDFADHKDYDKSMAAVKEKDKARPAWTQKPILSLLEAIGSAAGRWIRAAGRWKPRRKAQGDAARLKASRKRGGRLSVTMGHFLRNTFLNARYTERHGEEHEVSGRETYWSETGFVLYYCDEFDKWMIASADNWDDIRNGTCYFWAQADAAHEIREMPTGNSTGWFEWDDSKQEVAFRRHAGPHVIASEDSFASRTDFYDVWRWNKQCGKIFYNRGVRSQGESCDNCWAMATVTVLEWRVCMLLNGSFTGSSAALSAGYLTSCATSAFLQDNGCQGGSMVDALRWVGSNGIPTGGDGNNKGTCVPNFQNGLAHIEAPPRVKGTTQVPPACPTRCTNHRYPRTLKHDLFHLRGLSESWTTTAFESAAKSIRLNGPIMLNFDVYSDFLDYVPRTVYKHASNATRLYSHVVVAIGYSWSPKFLMCLNSWGDAWGNEGRFKLDPSEVKDYVIPGVISSSYPDGFPLPLPQGRGHGFKLWTSGFRQSFLNQQWSPVGKAQANKWISGKRTLWTPMGDMFIYWCAFKKRWAISSQDRFEYIREKGVCYWWALQGAKCDYLLDFECSWREYEPWLGHLVLRKNAGASGVTWEDQ